MPMGKATPTIPLEPYQTIKAWVDEREARGLPTYTTPEIIQRLLWQFAADVIKDKTAQEVVRNFEDIEGAFSSTVKRVARGPAA